MYNSAIIFALLFLCVASSLKIPFLKQHNVVQDFSNFNFLNKPQESENLGFSWNNCGSPSDAVQLKEMTIGPDPVVLGENVTFSFSMVNGVNIPSAKAEITMKKKVLGKWAKIPCVDQIGSCTYDDICSFLKPGPCPPPFSTYNIPCNCPFPPGSYTMPTQTIPTKNPGIDWLTNGDYYLKTELYLNGTQHIACYEFYVSIKSE